jgi:hypothetical protein
MIIKEWIPYSEAENYEESFGGMGGFFREGMRWKDYLEYTKLSEKDIEYANAIKDAVIELHVKHGGDWHQNSDEGVPLFSDNTVATFSFRAWGDIIAAIWAEYENKDYSYMDFYLDCCME